MTLLLLSEKNMIELLEALEGARNVSFATYNTDTQIWTIHYKNGLDPDFVPSEMLIEFLNNA